MSYDVFVFGGGIGYAIRYEEGQFINHCITSASVGIPEKKEVDEVMIMKQHFEVELYNVIVVSINEKRRDEMK